MAPGVPEGSSPAEGDTGHRDPQGLGLIPLPCRLWNGSWQELHLLPRGEGRVLVTFANVCFLEFAQSPRLLRTPAVSRAGIFHLRLMLIFPGVWKLLMGFVLFAFPGFESASGSCKIPAGNKAGITPRVFPASQAHPAEPGDLQVKYTE